MTIGYVPNENWEKEFDKKFKANNTPRKDVVFDTEKMKDFIYTLLSQTRKESYNEGYEKGRLVDSQVPMGVSQWRNHGKKFHYWEWFEKETLEEIEKCLPKELEIIEEATQYHRGFKAGFNRYRELIQSKIKELMK